MLDFLIYCVFVGALGLSLVVAGGGSSPVVVRERLLAGASPGSGAQTLGQVGSGASPGSGAQAFTGACGLRGCPPSSGAQALGHVGSGAALLALEHRLSLGHVGSGAALPALEHRLSSSAHRLRCPSACGIFPSQGWKPCPLYWQMGS